MTKRYERGENEITRAAKQQAARTGRDVAAILREWLAESKKQGDKDRVAKIIRLRLKSISVREIAAATKGNAMNWFAAHLIMAVRLKSGRQKRVPIWQNIVLVQAASEEEAFAKAEKRGRQDEGDDDGSFLWDGAPATWEFAGVRKLTACETFDQHPGDLDEITYHEFELASEAALRRYVRGESVELRSMDHFADETETAVDPAHRKGA